MKTTICIILVSFTASLGQRHTLYDVISELPISPFLRVEETVSVPVKTQCSLHCQQRSWCHFFSVCSTTSSTKNCHLFKEDVTSPKTPFNASGCSVCKAEPKTPMAPVDVASVSTTLSDPQTSHTTDRTGGSLTTAATQFLNSGTGSYLGCSLVDSSLSGLFTIWPIHSTSPVQVPCVSGRTLVQRRDSSCQWDFFNLPWYWYGIGFADFTWNCFWLGNEKIRTITALSGVDYDLVIKLGIGEDVQTAAYSRFKLERAENKYKLVYEGFYSDYDGDGKAMVDGFGVADIHGKEFFTLDRDSSNACAFKTESGWWFDDDCEMCNLNHKDGPKWLNDSEAVTTYDWSEMSLTPHTVSPRK